MKQQADPHEEEKHEAEVFRRGFGLKGEILSELDADYHSPIVDQIRQQGGRISQGGLALRLAKEFGFCYGVDRAIDFAYETHRRFPGRRIFLTNEIIHNPRVNRRLLEMGVQFLDGPYASGAGLGQITSEDVVIIPAFGVASELQDRLKSIGCVLVDTTCGSVVHVWKRVEKYAREGYTALIHGKWAHEETVATCSRVINLPGGRYIVVRDQRQAELLCEFIRTGTGKDRLSEDFAQAASPGFDFDRDLRRIGVANQTTMLSSETLAVAGMMREAVVARWGTAYAEENFLSFETICHATQERQDAVLEMMQAPPDLMLVIGGFNSSNTGHLCEISRKHCPTYHVEDADCLVSPTQIRHMPPQKGSSPLVEENWLPVRRPLEIGITAGASTPNRVIGEVIERLLAWEAAVQK